MSWIFFLAAAQTDERLEELDARGRTLLRAAMAPTDDPEVRDRLDRFRRHMRFRTAEDLRHIIFRADYNGVHVARALADVSLKSGVHITVGLELEFDPEAKISAKEPGISIARFLTKYLPPDVAWSIHEGSVVVERHPAPAIAEGTLKFVEWDEPRLKPIRKLGPLFLDMEDRPPSGGIPDQSLDEITHCALGREEALMVVEPIQPKLWESRRFFIQQMPRGNLMVGAPKDTLKEVEDLASKARSIYRERVHVEVVVAAVSSKAPEPISIDEARRQGHVLASFQYDSPAEQPVVNAHTRIREFVTGFDAWSMPVKKRVEEGARVEVRVSPLKERFSVSIQLGLTNVRSVETLQARGYQLHLPDVENACASVSGELQDGRAEVLGRLGGFRFGGVKPEHDTLLIVLRCRRP